LLIENKYRGEQVKASVIGIGINVNQTDFGSQTKATSLKLNTIEILDPIEMARTLHEKLLESVTIIHQESPETLFGAYQSFLYKKNEITDFNIDGKLCRALVKGVDEQGFLLVEQDGQEMKFRSGEITWVS
jgi:BirA family biotin operon repressor/biotin-[acetyl-CoA-carboxylase] ligase